MHPKKQKKSSNLICFFSVLGIYNFSAHMNMKGEAKFELIAALIKAQWKI